MTVLFGNNLNKLIEEVDEDNANYIIERIFNKMAFSKNQFKKFKENQEFIREKQQKQFKIQKIKNDTHENIPKPDNIYYSEFIDQPENNVKTEKQEKKNHLNNEWFQTFTDLMNANMPYVNQKNDLRNKITIIHPYLNIKKEIDDTIFNRLFIIDQMYRIIAKKFLDMCEYKNKQKNKGQLHQNMKEFKIDEEVIDKWVNYFCLKQNIPIEKLRKANVFTINEFYI